MAGQHRQILRDHDARELAQCESRKQALTNEKHDKQGLLSGTEHFERRGEILKRGALAKWKRCTPMRWQLPGRKNLPQASLLLIAGRLLRMRWLLRRLLPLQLLNEKHVRKKPRRIHVPTTGRLRGDGEAQANEEMRRCARSHNGEVRQQKQGGRAQRERCLKRRAPITLLGSCEKKNLIIIPV